MMGKLFVQWSREYEEYENCGLQDSETPHPTYAPQVSSKSEYLLLPGYFFECKKGRVVNTFFLSQLCSQPQHCWQPHTWQATQSHPPTSSPFFVSDLHSILVDLSAIQIPYLAHFFFRRKNSQVTKGVQIWLRHGVWKGNEVSQSNLQPFLHWCITPCSASLLIHFSLPG
jgi:hypothetical protein